VALRFLALTFQSDRGTAGRVFLPKPAGPAPDVLLALRDGVVPPGLTVQAPRTALGFAQLLQEWCERVGIHLRVTKGPGLVTRWRGARVPVLRLSASATGTAAEPSGAAVREFAEARSESIGITVRLPLRARTPVTGRLGPRKLTPLPKSTPPEWFLAVHLLIGMRPPVAARAVEWRE
jgi:hypothetical protein